MSSLFSFNRPQITINVFGVGMSQADVDARTARLQAALGEISKDIAEFVAKVKAGQPVDFSAMDATIAQLEALGANTDASKVNADEPPTPPADEV